MSAHDWSFPTAVQPDPAKLRFDLERAYHSMVSLHSVIPSHAFTAEVLGTERHGNGIAIISHDQVLILTMGYVIAEAEQLWITLLDGRVIPGHVLAYDYVSGFGLVLPWTPLDIPALPLGDSDSVEAGDNVVVLGAGGASHSLLSRLIAKREFAGYWEYLLDEALLVSPPHPQWAGAAMLNPRGELVAVGSLLLQEQVSGDEFDANLFVPIDLLWPLLGTLFAVGKARRLPPPWLGLYTQDHAQVQVVDVVKHGPAELAGIKVGDVITHVAQQAVNSMISFYRRIRELGHAGCIVPLTVVRGTQSREIAITSAARDDYLIKPNMH